MNAEEPLPGPASPRAPGMERDRRGIARELAHNLGRNLAANLQRWLRVIAVPPRAAELRPPLPVWTVCGAIFIALLISMFRYDAAASDWTLHAPPRLGAFFAQITDLGLSGWFLFPFGFLVVALAALISPSLSLYAWGVLTALAARFGFLFLAIGVPGLFVTIVKRLIGRARPNVGPHDDPYSYMPFSWRPDYASMPSGHSTTSVAAALAIGAVWPASRGAMWLYALTIMVSRVVVLAHHPSDVLGGAIVGCLGVCLVRRWFAAKRLIFSARDLRAFPGPSMRRIGAAYREALAKLAS